MSKRFPTLADVAREAGVAPITVSRVVNNSASVERKTREKVLQAISKLHYQPSENARKLKAFKAYAKTDVISIIVPDITNTFYANIVNSVEEIMRKNGFDIMIFNSRFSADLEIKFLELSVANRVDGIILDSMGGKRAKSVINNILVHNRIPIVILESYFDDIDAKFILHQNYKGMYLLTQHLIKEHSHDRIGYLSFNIANKVVKDRLEGYKQALIDSGSYFDADLVKYGSKVTIEEGYTLTKSLISMKKPPSAIVCSNTVYGIGAFKYLKDLKIKIPKDIALVTFDEYDINSLLKPSLTSLTRVDMTFGEYGGTLLLHKIVESEEVGGEGVIEVPAQLVIRESCGCIFEEE